MNFLIVAVMIPVGFGIGYGGAYLWERRKRRLRKRTQYVTISGSFHTGGPVALPSIASARSIAAIGQSAFTAGQTMNQMLTSLQETFEPLEETWSNEKVEAWRVIDVQVEKGDPDGLWLGFPHPDGPTADRFTPVRHPVGVELHAKCALPQHPSFLLTSAGYEARTLCVDVPGEYCKSGVGYGCGFYAFKTRDQAVYVADRTLRFGAGVAVAHVLLSGKVIEHETGYRAEILEVVKVEKPTKPVPVLLGDAIWPTNPWLPHIASGGS